MTTSIHRRVDALRAGRDPAFVARLASGWAVLGERQFLPGYCLLLPDPVVPTLNALQGGNCIAFLFDDTLIVSTLSGGDAKWANYEMPLASEDPQLWAIGVRLDDLNGPFGKFMKDVSTEWHKSGTLVALEKKHGIKSSPYLLEMYNKMKGS